MSTPELGKPILQAQAFQKQLLNWFDRFGRKNLPWQIHKTAYRVWISEIMLQQTQVTTVIPYFERFMAAFPDLQTLAAAEQDEVLHLWAGLGYYSRARNLHKAARMIMTEYSGQFPDTLAQLIALPGIGKSTAGAILALAFQKKASILDGNVKRVLARFYGIQTAINDKKTENLLWQLADYYASDQRPADYTQAMMDLGATCCIPKNPVCTQCPLQRKCCAHQKNLTHLIPQKKRAKQLPVKAATLFICRHGDKILVTKRKAQGIWGGLWSLLQQEGAPHDDAIATLCREYFHSYHKKYALLPMFRHTFTHYHLDIHPIVIYVRTVKKNNFDPQQFIWYDLQNPPAIGLPKPVQHIFNMIKT